jgi:hypothetical protein
MLDYSCDNFNHLRDKLNGLPSTFPHHSNHLLPLCIPEASERGRTHVTGSLITICRDDSFGHLKQSDRLLGGRAEEPRDLIIFQEPTRSEDRLQAAHIVASVAFAEELSDQIISLRE